MSHVYYRYLCESYRSSHDVPDSETLHKLSIEQLKEIVDRCNHAEFCDEQTLLRQQILKLYPNADEAEIREKLTKPNQIAIELLDNWNKQSVVQE